MKPCSLQVDMELSEEHTTPASCMNEIGYLERKFTYYREKQDTLVVASKDVGLVVNADKTKYLVVSQDQNAGQSHNIKTDNISCERVEEFRYLRTNLTYQHSIQEEIKSRLKVGMLAFIRCRIFCLPVFYLKMQGLRCTKL